MTLDTIPKEDSKDVGARQAMTAQPPERPHFRRPPILEQAISLSFERITSFDLVDFGLFWERVQKQFPRCETGARFVAPIESFEEVGTPISFSLVGPVELPRSLLRNDRGELIQLQDDSFGFNWIKPSADSDYPRFEHTSARLWELFSIFVAFLEDRGHARPTFRQCELTNVNFVAVRDFGSDFSDMCHAFIVDPFAWNVEGLVAETYIRRRQHKIVDEDGRPVGRLHSAISPVFRDGEKAFQFELTARSPPSVRTEVEAKSFFDRAHRMINQAFWVSVTPKMRELWGEYDG
jgi:uncharacterized protein (TIGR04255 family)